MNGFVRFLCLIFGISVDGDADRREAWAKKRESLGLHPDTPQPPDAAEIPTARKANQTGERRER